MRRILLGTGLVLGLMGAARAADPQVLNDQARFPEGPEVIDGTLYYVEYGGHTIMTWDGKANATLWTQEGCGPSALLGLPGGDFLVTCYDSGTIARVSKDGQTLANYDKDMAGGALLGPNDITTDGEGGAWFTTSGPWESGPIVGKVFHINAEGVIVEAANDLHYANGITLSADGKRLLVNESEAARVISFEVEPYGTLGDRRLFARLADLGIAHEWGPYPDGIKRDAKGNYWVGHYSAGQIAVLDPEGKLLGTLDVPSAAAPNLAFSADGKTVYVMAVDDTANAPYLGKVYAVANPWP
jgi:gluconolactonase